MDIQQLHIENNAYRDMINDLKRKINDYDLKIKVNEVEIGRQIEDMAKVHMPNDCTLCMGHCDAAEE